MSAPWMVAAFDGWNDAADAATGVVDHLIEEWDAELVVELDPEDYYDFQVHRPHVSTTADGDRVVTWPAPQIFRASPPRLGRDVLLLRAPEPNLRWRAFCAEVLAVATEAGVTQLITLGALLADSPHTRPVPVTGSAISPSTYNGPVGIPSVLTDAASREGIASSSLWAAVPHYLAEPPCPKATLALLGALEDTVGVALPQGVLSELAEAWQRGADELTAHDEDVAEYVEALENERDTSELPEASGDAIAKEFERYLRRRNADPE